MFGRYLVKEEELTLLWILSKLYNPLEEFW